LAGLLEMVMGKPAKKSIDGKNQKHKVEDTPEGLNKFDSKK
jgi:hypothetical protein